MRKRIAIGLFLWMAIVLTVFGGVSYYLVKSNTDSLLRKRLAMAVLLKEMMEGCLRENINRLFDVAYALKTAGLIELEKQRTLESVYSYSIFTDGVGVILDNRLVYSYPASFVIDVASVISGVSKSEKFKIVEYETSDGDFYLVFVVPIVVEGETAGYVVGVSNPKNPVFSYKLAMSSIRDVEKDVKIEIVDRRGRIIASSDPDRTLKVFDHKNFFTNIMAKKKSITTLCHECHVGGKISKEVLLFVPMDIGPFGIVWREPESTIRAPMEKFRVVFVGFIVFFIFVSHVLIIGLGKSVVDPIRKLIVIANRIALGDLEHPVIIRGSDEIVMLGRAFEIMRVRLLELIERIKMENLLLEERVKEKTALIMEDQKRIKYLLEKVLKAQEEERKRIARELHDDTMQKITSVIMEIELCKMNVNKVNIEKIDEIQNRLRDILSDLRLIIRNLRPPLLDDFGLIPAIKWLLSENLEKRGVNVMLNINVDEDLRFDRVVENEVFRIVQEAVNNIVKHSMASNVCFTIKKMKDDSILFSIRDDGVGFDVSKFINNMAELDKSEDLKGFGLIGMYERAKLIGGKLGITSRLGKGTTITLIIPGDKVVQKVIYERA